MKGYPIFLALLLSSSLACAASQSDMEKLLELNKAQSASHLDLSNADLRQYVFATGKLDLQGANLSHSNLSGVDLSKMNLGGANLSYADLSGARLIQVNLADANLEHANLSGAQLQQSDLSRANLSFANMAGAQMQQAIFARANLTCANLNLADLSKSNFAVTNISGASFVNTNTTDIVSSEVVDNHVSCSAQG